MPEKIPIPHDPTASTNATNTVDTEPAAPTNATNAGGTEPAASTNTTNAGGTEPAVRLVTTEGQTAHKDSAGTEINDQLTALKIEVIKLDAKIDIVKETLKTKIDEKVDGVEKSLKAEIGAVEKSVNTKIDAKIDSLATSLDSYRIFTIALLVAILATLVVTSILR
jgi:uncharacterized coiled-coil protein SlyX